MSAIERPFSEFREELRYEYPELTPESVVLDCGGHEGRFAEEMARRHGCFVHVLEPVRAFNDRTWERLKGLEKVKVWPFGIGAASGPAVFRVKGDMTGAFADDGPPEEVSLMGVDEAWRLGGTEAVDVLKLNIEGGEFAVLEKAIAAGLITRFRNIQVQWHHVAPDSAARFGQLQDDLDLTHELTWDFGWVWQNWKLRK